MPKVKRNPEAVSQKLPDKYYAPRFIRGGSVYYLPKISYRGIGYSAGSDPVEGFRCWRGS